MHRGTIVPHDDVARPPRVATDVVRLCRLGDELGDQRLPLVVGHPLDRVGVRGKIERAAIVRGITPAHVPAHRRQHLALRGGHQLGIDLVARIGVAVPHDEIAQPRLTLRRQALPGEPHRYELRLAAGVGHRPRREDRGQRRGLLERAVGVPELVGARDQRLTMGLRYQRAVGCQIVERAVERADADRADLHDLQRTEGAREHGLQIVRHRLASEEQHRMCLEGGAHLAIGRIARDYVEETYAFDLDTESRTDWLQFHPLLQVEPTATRRLRPWRGAPRE